MMSLNDINKFFATNFELISHKERFFQKNPAKETPSPPYWASCDSQKMLLLDRCVQYRCARIKGIKAWVNMTNIAPNINSLELYLFHKFYFYISTETMLLKG